MTLKRANQRLLEVDCGDPGAVAAALHDRARAIAEFAASAADADLRETLVAGDVFRDRLERARVETRQELERMTELVRGIRSTMDQGQPDRVSCFG